MAAVFCYTERMHVIGAKRRADVSFGCYFWPRQIWVRHGGVIGGLMLWLASGCGRAPLPAPGTALPITNVWAGHPVDFDLLTLSGRQFVAFYDADRWMTVAARALDSPCWEFVRLPSQLGWDSHNYVTLAVDTAGFLHVSGNMHNDPLVYFRATKAWDIHSLTRIPRMTGDREDRCTQPRFLHGPHGEFIFTYRYGGSGDAINLYNIYDHGLQTWRRLLDQPLLSGEGQRSAYPYGPVPGPDGYFHLVWVWRDTPDCGSNHDVCYARSRDLVHWETSAGRPLRLPITYAQAEIVDPVPPQSGLLNGNTMLTFDVSNRPVIAYHKYDRDGFTQLYYARREESGWRIYCGTRWRYRWELSGMGTIPQEIKFRPPVRAQQRYFLQWYEHTAYGREILVLNEELQPIGRLHEPMRPPALEQPQGTFPGLRVQWCAGRGDTPRNRQFWLRWETLDFHRDQPRDPPWPPPALLTVHVFTPLHALPVRRLRPLPHYRTVGVYVAISNLVRNGDFSRAISNWFPWQHAKTDPGLITHHVEGTQSFLRVANPRGVLIGLQQPIVLASGQVYRLAAVVRASSAGDPKALFGARVAVYAPPEPERALVWMHPSSQWTRKQLVFTNQSSVTGVVFAHLGYGRSPATGDFAHVALELLDEYDRVYP
ncbi:MAG: BNR-4 repeat-containing protein [bacterium]|nr:BNR-4 repeat-containing protein [bacterium]